MVKVLPPKWGDLFPRDSLDGRGFWMVSSQLAAADIRVTESQLDAAFNAPALRVEL